MKTIRDAVHGDIRLSADEMALVDTPTFQRLRGIKQLGTSSLVYPSATHTRFEHSLGTAWLTQRLLESLARAGYPVDAEDGKAAVLAGLLHDVTHVPFGHTFEDERRLMERHDRDPARIAYLLRETPLGQKIDLHPVGPRVRRILENEPDECLFIRDLVSGTVCADLLDYLRRDAYHCGLRLDYDERLFDYFLLAGGRLAVKLHKGGDLRHDVLSELIHLLQFRYTLTERVYYHHAKVASGAMVSRALELALSSGEFAPRDLYDLGDDTLLDRLAGLSGRVEGMAELIGDLRSHQLYQRAYLLAGMGQRRAGLDDRARDEMIERFHFDVARRERVECEIADRLGISPSSVIVYCPAARMQLKEADVPVEIADGVVVPLSSLDHPDVTGLSQKHRGLWRFYVFARRGDPALVRRVGEVCAEVFGHDNQLDDRKTAARS